MPPVTNGKSGTIKPEEYTQLSALVGQYGAKLLAQKVVKICDRIAAPYKHEYANSLVGNAWSGLGARISAAVGQGTRPISTSGFTFLSNLVNTYGAEVVVNKLAKIATRSGNTADANALKVLFPRTTTARAA